MTMVRLSWCVFFFLPSIFFLCEVPVQISSQEQSIISFSLPPSLLFSFTKLLLHLAHNYFFSWCVCVCVCVCVFRMASTCSKMSLLNIRIVPVVSSNCKSGVLSVENIYCWERRSILWKCVQKAYSLNRLLSIISHVKPNKPKFKKQLKISAT